MPVPSPRNKILPVRGNIATLQSNVASLLEGEICYALDGNRLYVKESGALVEASGGRVIQVVRLTDGVYATGSVTIPVDNTIPQSTEGIQFMSLAITPTSATNKLLITVNATFCNANADWITGALFQDAGTSAIASWPVYVTTAGGTGNCNFSHYMTAGTTSATTFYFKAGPNTAGTVHFNGNTGGAHMGGTAASSITITEIAA